MAQIYKGEWDGDYSEVPEIVLKNPKNERIFWLSADEPRFQWKSQDECTQREYVLYISGIGVGSDNTEPSELKFEVEPGKLFTVGTFGSCLPHIGVRMDSMKFDVDITFYLSGPGPKHIFAVEIEKSKWFWQDAKKFFDRYIWNNKGFRSSKVKTQ